jgi:hypothetical protein
LRAGFCKSGGEKSAQNEFLTIITGKVNGDFIIGQGAQAIDYRLVIDSSGLAYSFN